MSARRLSGLVSILALVSGASCAHRPPPPLSQNADARLPAERTRFGLSSYFLVPKPRCTPISPAAELCDFRLGKNNPGYRELAADIGTRQKITVLCAFPLPRAEADRGTCTTHRHDGDELKLEYQHDSSWWNRKRPRTAEQTELFTEFVTHAQTAFALSDYFGQAPDQCTGDATQSSCYWTLTASSPRYERSVLATRLTEPFHPPRAKLHVACAFPADGSPRPQGSCRASIDSDAEHTEVF